MGVVTLRRLDQLGDNMRGRRLIGISHAEINDILAARTRRRLQLIDYIEDIGRQPLYSGKLVHGQYVMQRLRLDT